MLHILEHVLEHTILDTLKLVPFLFLTYLAMEYLENKAGERTEAAVKKAGKWGPLVGGIAGVVPQCGFSAAAANLYAGKVITLGTLIAIFLSTSDEMLPILISEKVQISLILKILGMKAVFGAAAGFMIDFVLRARNKHVHMHNVQHNVQHTMQHDILHIHEICEQDHCHCEKGILHSTLVHTLKITGFILFISLILNLVLESGGEELLVEVLYNRPVLGPVIAGLVGLVPNCASSIALTRLYVEGAMGFGTMMAGLLVGAGVGVLVLCRVNRKRKENLKIIALLYGIGVGMGILFQLFG